MSNFALPVAPRALASRIGHKLHTWRYYASVLGFRQTLLLQTARMLQKSVVSLSIPGIPHRVKCRPTNSERFTLGQVFIERDSDVSLPGEPRFIIDGGANVGYASIVFANKYPQAQIIAVEPELDFIHSVDKTRTAGYARFSPDYQEGKNHARPARSYYNRAASF